MERERAIRMLKANVTPLIETKRFQCHVRTIGRLKNRSNTLGQRHTVRIQGVDVCLRDVKIEQPRHLICAIDFICSQSQLGNSKELIIQNIRAQNVRNHFKGFVKDPQLPTFDGI